MTADAFLFAAHHGGSYLADLDVEQLFNRVFYLNLVGIGIHFDNDLPLPS